MSDTTFLALFLGVQLLFLGLDLLDRYLPEHEPRPKGSASPLTLVFMLGVLAVYFALQVGLMSRVPRPDQVVADLAASLGGTSTPVPPGPLLLAVLAGLYFGGLVDYLVHRFFSHHRWFFFSHEYHHLPSEVFLLMPGLAARPFAVVSTFPVTVATAASAYGTLALSGHATTDLAAMKILILIQVFLLLTSHSSFLRRSWLPHQAMRRLGWTTPQEHLLHHAVDLRGNFANLTTVWDRLFGTYLDPSLPENQGHRLGLDYDQDWLGAISLGLLKLPERWRRFFDVGRWCNLS